MKNYILLVLGLFIGSFTHAQLISTNSVSSGDGDSIGTLVFRLETNEDIDNDSSLDNGEAFVDANGNGIWDAAESFIDSNGNGVWDDDEFFDDVDGDGSYDPAESFTDFNGNGQWDQDEDLDNDGVLDDTNEDLSQGDGPGDNRLDAGEPFVDANNNGIWDDAESFTDSNGNNQWDAAEVFSDANLNGQWDDAEVLLTDENNNGVYDDAEVLLTDENGNGVYDDAEVLTLDNNNNGLWDDGEDFLDDNGNGVWDDAVEEVLGDNPDTPDVVETDFVLVAATPAELFVDADLNNEYTPADTFEDADGDGAWDPADTFTDLDNDNAWDPADTFVDADNSGAWEPAEAFVDSESGVNANGTYDAADTFVDADGDGAWDPADTFTDLDGDGVWDPADTFVDAGNGVWSLSEQLNVGNIGGYQTSESIKLNGDGSTFVASRTNSGVRVYKSTGSGYQQLGSELTSELTGDISFGWSSDINYAGNTILVGSPYEVNYSSGYGSGSLRLFKFTNGDWQQYGKTYYGESNDYLGTEVSLSSSGQSFVSSFDNTSSWYSRGVYGYGEFNLSDFSITSTDGSYILSSANSSMSGNIELPYSINHSPYELSPSVFKDCTLIESVSLPDFIDEIPDSAFENCTSLKSIEFGSLTTSIGDNAFKNCSNLFISDLLLDITLVGESAFENSGITFFNIAPGCSVGNDAFKDASFLKTLTIGEGSTFGSNVFASCASLDYVYLDETPDTFSSDFFTSANPDIILISNSDRNFDLSSLSNQSEYIDIDNYTVVSSELISASNLLLDVYLPAFYEGEYITSIADYYGGNAFVNSNHTITSVNVPPNYVAIPARFINRCNAFSGAFLPDSITSIESHAFAYNPILSDISLPRRLNSIGEYFLAETFVDGIVIPETINEIPEGAFAGCSVLTSLTFPNTITNIGQSAFVSTNLNTIEIPASVRSIKTSTFYYCNNLETVILNEGLESIGISAFQECGNLTSVQLPNSLTSIGNHAFYDSGLTSINIPGGVINVPNYAFHNCDNLETVILNEGVESIERWAFSSCNNLTSVQLPNSLTSIGNYAFYDSGLTSINIPGGVINVPESAFYYSNDLETVNLNEGTRIINTGAFRSTNISEISLPSTIQLISDEAFLNSGLERIIFKGNYPTIVGAPFSGSSEALTFYRTSNSTGFDNISEHTVKYIEVDAGVLEFITDGSQATLISCDSSAEGNLIVPATFNDLPVRTISNNALKDCSLINSIELPESIVDIGSSAFAGCTSLSSINIPSGVTQIKDNSFDGCISLTSIQFPVGLNSIGAFAFQNCGLSELSFPDSLVNIGQSAFADCDAIASLTVNASLNLALASFSNMDSLQNVYFNGDNIYGDSSSIFSGSSLLTEIFVLKQATGWSDQFEGIDVTVQTPIYFVGDIVETGVQLFVDEQCIIRAYNEGQDPLDYTYQWYLDGFPIQAIFNGRNNQFLIEGSDFYQSNWSVEVTDISSGTTNTFNFYLDIIRDSDGDGLFDYVETGTGTFVSLEDTGTDPNNSDSDGDTIDDKTEILLGLNPNKVDSDGDGLNDNNETGTGVYVSIYDTGTDPLLDDSDGDGYSDSFEVSLINFNPTNYNNFQFSDHGMYAINDPALLNYIKDLRPGSVAINVQGDEATISMNIQSSTDLVNWEVDSYIDVPMQIEEGEATKFFRFKMAE